MPARELRSRAIVAGVGTTEYGQFPTLGVEDLGIWALDNALADCGLTRPDIDGLIVNRIPDYQAICQMTGINPRFVTATPGHGRMSGATIELAAVAIASEMCDVIALVYGNNGKSSRVKYGGSGYRYGGVGSELSEPYGMTSPGAFHALMFARHQHTYGTTSDQLGHVAVDFRYHATLNPAAVMRSPLTLEQYRSSRFICEPLRVHDYCLINDGGVAMIITSSDRAAALKQKPVYIRGFGQASRLSEDMPPDDFWYESMRIVSADVCAMAGLSPNDVSGLMIYDNFSPTVLFALEGFGFCPVGESGAYVAEGHLRLGGRLPANTSGGHLSDSYMQGWSLNVEAVRQIRGECGQRQIPNASIIQYVSATPVVTSIVYGSETR